MSKHIEALIKYQNILTAMALGGISKEEGRKAIDALNKARDKVRFGQETVKKGQLYDKTGNGDQNT